jgi:hypothetical protein
MTLDDRRLTRQYHGNESSTTFVQASDFHLQYDHHKACNARTPSLLPGVFFDRLGFELNNGHRPFIDFATGIRTVVVADEKANRSSLTRYEPGEP